MFESFRTSTKLLILCGAFLISIAVPIYALVTEKQIAIAFARKELAGSRYLATVRDIYAAILAVGPDSAGRARPTDDATLQRLAAAQSLAQGRFETAELAQALDRALGQLWSQPAAGASTDALALTARARAQALAWRIGDDSNLALDPDLDTYYIQLTIVRTLPTLLGQLAEVQEHLQTSRADGSISPLEAARLPVLASLVGATAAEVKDNLAAAYRGNADGGLQRAVDGAFAALLSSIQSYLGALDVGASSIDAKDTAQAGGLHARALQAGIAAWALAQLELDRLLRQRIDGLLTNMWLGLALIGALAGLSIAIAVLTHRHIVRPLERLEAVASTVRETKDYSRRVDYTSQDEIGRVAAAFNDMLAELASARQRDTAERAKLARIAQLTSMGEMAASIAHEVNQPLAAIATNGEAGLRWLDRAEPDLDEARALMKRVVADARRAADIIARVRAMATRGAHTRVPVSLHQVIQESLLFLGHEIQSRAVSIRFIPASSLPDVRADRTQMQQVVVNLAVNAMQAMAQSPGGRRMLGIRTTRPDAATVCCIVEDSGPGIDAAHLDRLFESFFTTKERGMGMGLPICRSIIEAHGGQVQADNDSAYGGARFSFTLPAAGAAQH
jgi:signal transduction histidine kinase